MILKYFSAVLMMILALTVLAAGCDKDKLKFIHSLHVAQADCTDCHATADSGGKAGMPTEETCLVCHEEDEKVRYQAFVGSRKALTFEPTITIAEDQIFSHAVHAGASVACAACHRNIDKLSTGADAGGPDMLQCMQCHAQRGDENNCATCHMRLALDTPPPTHNRAWIVQHGAASRDHFREREAACSWCHTPAACEDCHRTKKPADHTQIWKEREHGAMVKLDRARCSVCHESDYCAACHSTITPRP